MTWFQWLRERLLAAKGLLLDPRPVSFLYRGMEVPGAAALRHEDLWESEWSPSFEAALRAKSGGYYVTADGWGAAHDKFLELMRNRLVQGAMLYGLINAPGKPRYPRMEGAVKRLGQYVATGNRELLIDIGNMCLLEWAEGDSRRPGTMPPEVPGCGFEVGMPVLWVGHWLRCYAKTGDKDDLVMIAMNALWEFVSPEHPEAHWADVHGDHCVAHDVK